MHHKKHNGKHPQETLDIKEEKTEPKKHEKHSKRGTAQSFRENSKLLEQRLQTLGHQKYVLFQNIIKEREQIRVTENSS